MKTTLYPWLTCIVLVTSVNATTLKTGNPYLSMSFGYAFPATGYVSGATVKETSYFTTYEINKNSPNRGFNIGLHGGYMFNPYIGADLGINYLKGSNVRIYEYNNIQPGVTNEQTINSEARSLRITPAIKFTGGYKGVNPYLRVGVGVFLLNRQTDFQSYSIYNGTAYSTSKATREIKGSVSLGFNGAIGLEYKINQIYFFSEISLFNQTFLYKSSEITAFTVNGVDNLGQLTTAQKKTEYSANFDIPKTTDSNSPMKSPVVSMPFNNYSFNLGLTIPLNRKRNAEKGI